MEDPVFWIRWLRKDPSKDNGKKFKINSKLFNNKNFSLLIFPLILIGSYFYLIGRDRYLVISDVVVRKSTDVSSSGVSLTSFLGAGNLGSIEDARYLRTYLQSPQVLDDLENVFDFRHAYRKKGLDILSGLSSNISREKKYKFFRKQISIGLNNSSGIIRIKTLAFDPITSERINKFLISQAEDFVNRLNQDIYKKQLLFAKEQVVRYQENVNESIKELENFQQDNILLDTEIDSNILSNILAILETKLSEKRVELAILKRQFLNPNDYLILNKEQEIKDLRDIITNERYSLVSPDGINLNTKASKLSILKSRLMFAKDMYKSALTTVEKTRVDSLQQQRFMAVLSKPLTPEDPSNYWRNKGFLTSAVIVLTLTFLVKFLFGMVESHET